MSHDKQPAASAPRYNAIPPEIARHVEAAQEAISAQSLGTHQAKVALVLDVSRSMENPNEFFNASNLKEGKVQKLIEKALGLAMNFDDDRSVEFFTFGAKGRKEREPITLGNYKEYLTKLVENSGGLAGLLEETTNYGAGVHAVTNYYTKDSSTTRNGLKQSDMPAFVIFITDGEDKFPAESKQAFIESSKAPIFFKIIALEGKVGQSFDFIQHLDDIPSGPGKERPIDNVDAKTLKDPSELNYGHLLEEYRPYVVQLFNEKMITENPGFDMSHDVKHEGRMGRHASELNRNEGRVPERPAGHVARAERQPKGCVGCSIV